MGLDKRNIAVTFGGLDQKTDPKQVAVGKSLSLLNAIFEKTHQLLKRYGFSPLPKLADNSGGLITNGVGVYSFEDETLIQDSNSIYSFSEEQQKWITKSQLVNNFDYSLENIIFDQKTKIYQDMAYDPVTDYQIFTYTDDSGVPATNQTYFSVIEKTSGNILINKQSLGAFGVSKVLLLNNNFVIVLINSANELRYLLIPCSTLVVPVLSTLIASGVAATNIFDATIVANNIFISVLKTASFNIETYRMTSAFVVSLRNTYASNSFNVSISVAGNSLTSIFILYAVDTTVTSYIKYVVYNDVTNTASSVFTEVTGMPTSNIGAVVNSSDQCFVNFFNSEPLQCGIRSLVFSNTGTTLVSPVFTAIGNQAVSKPFIYNGDYYFFCCPVPTMFVSTLEQNELSTDQQTMYLLKLSVTTSPVGINFSTVMAKIETGYAFLQEDLYWSRMPETIIDNGHILFGYLRKSNPYSDLGGISYKSGIKSLDLYIDDRKPQRKTLGQNLNFGAGELWLYDGENVVENNFNMYPVIIGTPVGTQNDGAVGTGLAGLGNNKLNYVAVYEWTDYQGQKHRSAPSIPSVVVPPRVVNKNTPTITFTGIIQTGNSSIQAGGAPGYTYDVFVGLVKVGDTITGTGLGGGLQVTSIVLGGNQNNYFIGLSAPVAATGTFTFTRPGNNTAVIITVNSTVESDLVTTTPASQLLLGQYLFSSTGSPQSIPDGSQVIADLGNGTYKLDQLATSTNANTMYSRDVFSYDVSVRCLSLTNKNNVSVVLYRTTINGSIFYRCSSPTVLTYNNRFFGFVNIVDTMSDYELRSQEQLYTVGGEVENIAAPSPEILVTYKNRLLNFPKDNPLEFWYSKQITSGFPVEFSDSFIQQFSEIGGPATAAAVLDEKLIIFKENRIFYMLGEGPAPNGTANDFTTVQLITSDVGCNNKNSIVNTSEGVMFQSNKGIYLLDRSLGVSYIGYSVEDLTTQRVISANVLLLQDQVRFAMEDGTILCYDTFQKQWSVFSGEGDSINEVDSEIINEKYTFVNVDGVVKKETPFLYSDYRTVSGVQTQTYIPISMDTSWISLAALEGYQRIYEFIFLGNYVSNHTVNIQVYYDFNESYFDTVPVLDAIPSGAPDVFKYRIFIPRQKCTSIRFKISEVQVPTYFGEGLKISSMTLLVGVKKGLDKIGPSQSYG